MKVSLVVAMSENRVIGRDGDMPWRLSSDLKRFKQLTMGHAIVMGRKTYESIGRLLPGRTTIILSRQAGYRVEGAIVVADLEQATVAASSAHPGTQELFVIGGGRVYEIALPLANTIYLTRVQTEIRDGDTWFPEVDWSAWHQVHQEAVSSDSKNDYPTTYEIWRRV
ncbi:MAG: dihydrofolate reductase [Pirellulaceae bacterium]